MAAERVLIDTGPLVALLNVRDPFHEACTRHAQQFRLPMLTTWLVVTEAAWLLRNTRLGVAGLLSFIENRVIQCEELGRDPAPWMSATYKQYADLKPQLADISLLYLADREGMTDIFTLDRRDFTVYRTGSGKPFNCLPA